jgi:transposase-like protein
MNPKDHKNDDFIDDTLPDVTEGETARVVDHIAERQLCRKFDVRLMPVLAIMCKIHVQCPRLTFLTVE